MYILLDIFQTYICVCVGEVGWWAERKEECIMQIYFSCFFKDRHRLMHTITHRVFFINSLRCRVRLVKTLGSGPFILAAASYFIIWMYHNLFGLVDDDLGV